MPQVAPNPDRLCTNLVPVELRRKSSPVLYNPLNVWKRLFQLLQLACSKRAFPAARSRQVQNDSENDKTPQRQNKEEKEAKKKKEKLQKLPGKLYENMLKTV